MDTDVQRPAGIGLRARSCVAPSQYFPPVATSLGQASRHSAMSCLGVSVSPRCSFGMPARGCFHGSSKRVSSLSQGGVFLPWCQTTMLMDLFCWAVRLEASPLSSDSTRISPRVLQTAPSPKVRWPMPDTTLETAHRHPRPARRLGSR